MLSKDKRAEVEWLLGIVEDSLRKAFVSRSDPMWKRFEQLKAHYADAKAEPEFWDAVDAAAAGDVGGDGEDAGDAGHVDGPRRRATGESTGAA